MWSNRLEPRAGPSRCWQLHPPGLGWWLPLQPPGHRGRATEVALPGVVAMRGHPAAARPGEPSARTSIWSTSAGDHRSGPCTVAYLEAGRSSTSSCSTAVMATAVARELVPTWWPGGLSPRVGSPRWCLLQRPARQCWPVDPAGRRLALVNGGGGQLSGPCTGACLVAVRSSTSSCSTAVMATAVARVLVPTWWSGVHHLQVVHHAGGHLGSTGPWCSAGPRLWPWRPPQRPARRCWPGGCAIQHLQLFHSGNGHRSGPRAGADLVAGRTTATSCSTAVMATAVARELVPTWWPGGLSPRVGSPRWCLLQRPARQCWPVDPAGRRLALVNGGGGQLSGPCVDARLVAGRTTATSWSTAVVATAPPLSSPL